LALHKVRVGINFGNALLANRDVSGSPRGIAVDLAGELGRRASLPVELVAYNTAGTMADGAKTGAWDVAFLAADPGRSEGITFTAPYLEIPTTYLVWDSSAFRTIADVDSENARVCVSEKSAYDLFLTRNLKHAVLVRTPGVDASVDLFFSEKLDALAGLKPLLINIAEKNPRTRVMDGSFTSVQQAVGISKDQDAAFVTFVREFIKDVKRSGFVREVMDRNGVRGVEVADM